MEDFSSFDCANFIRDFCFNYKSQISLWHRNCSEIGHISLVFFFNKTWFQLFLSWIDDQSYFRPELLTGQYQCVLGLVNFSNPSSDWGTFEPWENVLGDSRNTPPLSLFSSLRWVVGKHNTELFLFPFFIWLKVLRVQSLQVALLPARPLKLPQTIFSLLLIPAMIRMLMGITQAAWELQELKPAGLLC